MKNIFLLTLSLFLLFSCSEYNSNDYKQLNLHGKVKTLRSNKYNAVEKFGEVVKTSKVDVYDNDFEEIIHSNSLSEFNQEGRLKAISSFSAEGELFRKIINEDTTSNWYDGKGNLQMVMKVNDLDFPTEIDLLLPGGDLIGKVKLKYDSDNQLIEEKTYNEEGELIESNEFKYKNGLVYQKTSYVKQNRSMFNDEFKELIETYEYNEFKDVSKTKKNRNSLTKEFFYKYEYDSNNNWIKRIQFEEDKPVFIVEREIHYF